MQIYDVPAAWLHRVRYRALFRAHFRDTELCSYKPEFQRRIRSRINPKSHRYNADTAQAIRDLSLAEQHSLKRGMTVPESQQPLPQTITLPEVQERSTVQTHSPIEKASSGKCTWRRSNNCTPRTAKSACRELMANASTDESRSRMHILQTRMRSRLSDGDPDSVSTIPRYTAATGNQLQNQA